MFEEALLRSRSIDPRPLNNTDLSSTISRIALWMTNTLHAVLDGLLVTNSCGEVLFMNSRAEELTGWNLDTAVQRSSSEVFRLLDPSSGDLVDSPLREAYVEEEVFRSNGCVLSSPQGTATPIEYAAAPVRAEDGEVVGALVVFREKSASCGI